MNPSQNPDTGISTTPKAHSPPNPQANPRDSIPPETSN